MTKAPDTAGAFDFSPVRIVCANRLGERSVRAVRCHSRRVGQPAGLVVDVDGDLAELVAVFPGVVGAEQQLATTGERDTQVGLRTAPVATVYCGQR
jgi:hypothetical protein